MRIHFQCAPTRPELWSVGRVLYSTYSTLPKPYESCVQAESYGRKPQESSRDSHFPLIVGQNLNFPQNPQLFFIDPMTLFGGLAIFERALKGLAHKKLPKEYA